MLIITPELRKHMVSKFRMSDSLSDHNVRELVYEKIKSGDLSVEEVAELTKSVATDADDRFTRVVEAGVNKALGIVHGTGLTQSKGINPVDVFVGNGGGNVRVKCGDTSYLHTKSVGTHAKYGTPIVTERGTPAVLPSEYEHAKAGAFLKFLARKHAGTQLILTKPEQDLLEESYERDNWVGLMGNGWHKEISGLTVKTLLSESTSGGTFVNPDWFDDALITKPLLTGELLPLVDLREVPRGASVEGATIGNPEVNWGTNSGTAIPLFDTDGFINELNTSIHTVSVAVEVGRDFLSDAAADVGRYLLESVGQKFAAELDKVIAVGNGTSQPEGIFTASGLNSVVTGGGALVVDDVEALFFGIGKQYRTSKNCAYLSNDTNYQRVRAMPVDASSDARRIFGMTHEDYMVLNRPWKIQNDIPNTKLAFGDMKKYRLYRRLGFSIEWVTGGAELSRKNTMLLLARGRFGGRVVDADAFARATDAPA